MEHGDLTGQSEGTMWNFRALYRRTLLSLSYAAHSANFEEKVHKPQSKSYGRIGASIHIL